MEQIISNLSNYSARVNASSMNMSKTKLKKISEGQITHRNNR